MSALAAVLGAGVLLAAAAAVPAGASPPQLVAQTKPFPGIPGPAPAPPAVKKAPAPALTAPRPRCVPTVKTVSPSGCLPAAGGAVVLHGTCFGEAPGVLRAAVQPPGTGIRIVRHRSWSDKAIGLTLPSGLGLKPSSRVRMGIADTASKPLRWAGAAAHFPVCNPKPALQPPRAGTYVKPPRPAPGPQVAAPPAPTPTDRATTRKPPSPVAAAPTARKPVGTDLRAPAPAPPPAEGVAPPPAAGTMMSRESLPLPLRIFPPEEGWTSVSLDAAPYLRFVLAAPAEDSGVYCGPTFDAVAVRLKGGARIPVLSGRPLLEGSHTYFADFPPEQFRGRTGLYRLEVTSSAGCRVTSPNFSVGVCDYALGEVTFADGRDLNTGFAYDPVEDLIHADLKAEVTWNGIRGCDRTNGLRVRSVLTGEELLMPSARPEFTAAMFGPGRSLLLDINFPGWFENTAALRRGRFIPMEIALEIDPPQCDGDASNNRRTVDVRILAPQNNDLQVAVERDTSVPVAVTTREEVIRNSAGEVVQRFDIHTLRMRLTVKAKNLSSNDAGGPAPEVPDVNVDWQVESWNSVTGDWRRTDQYGRLPLPPVRTREWSEQGVDVTFNATDSSRVRARAVLVNPRKWMDPDLSNNTALSAELYP